ncbi:glycoside hydrolase family 2 protein [Gemmiger formicilis]|uniref:glycoside hydrolase family 2 protein n=1 Tax=Gemmiger formicilis TaxID=745368 RepID=UPI00195DFD9F|nr:glycoside hydrolase family 2 TIM barrel-domain containing protein [Gemmiger formicilis]MBM6715291.1 glycoside hydrolase family 2 protein [Gemmiger formicilis]
MRRSLVLDQAWRFSQPGQPDAVVTLPHTWNNIDGQDGGNDYKRCACTYRTTFDAPAYDAAAECVYLQFEGVNASARISLNGSEVCRHDGGYSTFRADITSLLKATDNELTVVVDNTVNDTVYPQKADFTFYGGIYRDVSFVIVNKAHFDLDHFGGTGLKVTPKPENGYKDGSVRVETWHNAHEGAEITVALLDAQGNTVAQGAGTDQTLTIHGVHLWDGIESPYLYTAVATLTVNGTPVDEVRTRFGVRDFKVDAKTGFWLNGRQYPLHGVSRHQDRKGLGNAITKAMHDEDMALIKEMGCNTVRLAHYQHDQYFYNLCDEAGMVVWAEIPYISEHMNNGRENTISQMNELIIQNYNHPCIVCWGVSNEITISTKDKKDMLDNHHELNDLCHRMDPTRLTTLACYAMCGPFNPVAHITDLVSWNLYLGWYVPGLFLNDLWMDFFHLVYPNRPLGYSEYGAEAMPNLHSAKPRRGDHTEDYQARYHEYMLRCFDRHKWLWATHVWNMFDFAADARDQGGEPGMNHKGLVTFDRKIKKDSFYLYKAWWSKDPFVYIAGRRYADRTESTTTVTVYTNQPSVALYANGKKVGEQTGDKVFRFKLPLQGEVELKAVAGDCIDQTTIRKVDTPNPAYKLQKGKSQSANWV